jgi:hypothetical protein
MSPTGGSPNEERPGRPPRRKVVSPERLLRLLNQRLENYGHCHACRFVGPIRALDDETEDGRNWSQSVAFVCSQGMGSGCKRIAQRILDDAAAEYNLRPTT